MADLTHSFVSAIPDDPAAALAGEVLPSHWNAAHLDSSGSPAQVRIQLTVDTTYYVATTGNDTTGDGSIGNPWLTIQHAANYVMYNVTGQGVIVVIQVEDSVTPYAENIQLGPHQIYASPGVQHGTVILRFSSTSTPGNVVIAPTSLGPAASAAIITAQTNANWQLEGGVTITFGASGNDGAFASYDGSNLRICSAAVVFSDFVNITLDAEFDGSIAVQDSSVLHFNSTVGTLCLTDHDSAITLYSGGGIIFDVDPLFSTGTFGGMFAANFSGGCSIDVQCPYAGFTTTATPQQCVIDYGNKVTDVHTFLPATAFTLNNLASYNGSIGASLDFIKSGYDMEVGFDGGATPPANFCVYDVVADLQAFITYNDGTNGYVETYNLGVFSWTSAAKYAGHATRDTGLSRIAPAVVGVGNGTQGDFSGTLKLTTADFAGNASIISQAPSGLPWTLTLPANPGTNTYLLQTDGSGVTSWVAGPAASSITVGVTDVSGYFANAVLYADGGDKLAVDPTNVFAYDSNGQSLQTVSIYHLPVTIATLLALPSPYPLTGQVASVSDGDALLIPGQTVVNSGAGATPYLVWYNGSAWKVVAV